MSSKKYRQGIFTPVNKSKFIGTRATYRSGLELKFMRFCDNNINVIQWGSENVIVPYISPLDGRVHRYFVDNYVVIREGLTVNRYLIEIKPSSQLKIPTTKYKKKEHLIYEQSTYIINQAKWAAAAAYALKHNCIFKIITEKELNN